MIAPVFEQVVKKSVISKIGSALQGSKQVENGGMLVAEKGHGVL
jgi:hypothetical protein